MGDEADGQQHVAFGTWSKQVEKSLESYGLIDIQRETKLEWVTVQRCATDMQSKHIYRTLITLLYSNMFKAQFIKGFHLLISRLCRYS